MALVAIKARYLTKGLVMASPVAVLEAISQHRPGRHCTLFCCCQRRGRKAIDMTSVIFESALASDLTTPTLTLLFGETAISTL